MKIFVMKSESFLTCRDSYTTDTFKAQKGSKDIVKTVILWSYENTFNEGLTGLERHKSEQLMTEFSFLSELSL